MSPLDQQLGNSLVSFKLQCQTFVKDFATDNHIFEIRHYQTQLSTCPQTLQKVEQIIATFYLILSEEIVFLNPVSPQ